jgi:LmbE family N-acetylglucosaminyl deacetylase
MTYTALFFGAHPDDIEIGAGGIAAKLIALGWKVYFCVLTRELDASIARIREAEALRAAEILGLQAEHVIFVNLSDPGMGRGSLEIDRIREALADRIPGEVDLVFSHTRADAHTDHVTAYTLTPQLIKQRPILCYPIVNHLKPVEFRPDVIIDVSDQYDRKIEAIRAHQSQDDLGRLLFDEIDKLSRKHARRCPGTHAEPFELEHIQGTDEELLQLARSLDGRRRRLYPIVIAVLALLLGAVVLGRQFTQPLPGEYSQRGEVVLWDFESNSHLAGRVVGFSPEECRELKVLVYVLTDKWYVHPWDSPEPGKGYAAVDDQCAWRISSVWHGFQAKRLALLVTHAETQAPPRVEFFGNADRALLSEVDPLSATIMEAPSGL